MITSLRLKRFKSFEDAELKLGPFTVLVGANASGKSNIRDAFRFLHGIGRGYNLADIFGEKYGDGGERIWTGIRGGPLAIVYSPTEEKEPTFELDFGYYTEEKTTGFYQIEILPLFTESQPVVVREAIKTSADTYFDFRLQEDGWLKDSQKSNGRALMSGFTPVLAEFFVADKAGVLRPVEPVKSAIDSFKAIRFFDFDTEAMRQPSFKGQPLGDKGQNLSSALYSIYEDETLKLPLVSWIQALTPMDVTDFDFVHDPIGRILLNLIEKDGRITNVYSASDGTLRFIGLLAAMFGPNPPKLIFIEKLEIDIHPTRQRLLVSLIEQQAEKRGIQVVATTHSPQILRVLSAKSLENASVVFRPEGQSASQIRRILDIPNAREVITEQDIGMLHDSSWFEDILNGEFYRDETVDTPTDEEVFA